MARTVVLHIGAMKSGTSFVQRNLGDHRDLLAEQGVLFPGARWRKQVLAVLDVLGRKRDGTEVKGSSGAWQRLVDEIDAWSGTAVVSMEFLGPANEERVERVVSSFPSGTEVRVVMTARDLGRNIPAMWQEGLKNGRSWGWHEFLHSLEHDRPRRRGPQTHADRFWRQMDFPGIAERWMKVAGAERFTLVTVPHPGAGPRELWDRFCAVVGMDPAPFDTSGASNTSLGAASAQVLRALNESLEPAELGLTTQQYLRTIKHGLAKQGMSVRAGAEPPIGFDAPWVAGLAQAQIDRLAALGVRVVGDLEELRPVAQAGIDPETVGTEEQLAAAIDAMGYLVRMCSSP